jgi:hypothetical protein
MRMLADLPYQHFAIIIRHPIFWLNPNFVLYFILKMVQFFFAHNKEDLSQSYHFQKGKLPVKPLKKGK